MSNQSHLSFPFASKCVIAFKNGTITKTITCELARSVIELFQSLNFRRQQDFTTPLLLWFEDPNVQSYVLTNYAFPVDQICVDVNGIVSKCYVQPVTKASASFIHAYSSYRFIVLAPSGFIKKYKIKPGLVLDCSIVQH